MTQTKQLCSTAITLPDSLEAVNDYFYSRGYTDGLPIVSPTKERVEAMIEAAGRNGNEIIAKLPPTLGQATVI